MLIYNTHSGLRGWLSAWALGSLALAILLSAAPWARAAHAKLTVVTRSYAVPDPFGPVPTLNDLSQSGLMLFDLVPGGPAPAAYRKQGFLSLLRPGELKPSLQIGLPEMADYAQQAGNYRDTQPGPFRFSPDGKSIIGIQIPWLVLISLEAQKEVRRVRPCGQELVWMKSRDNDYAYPPVPSRPEQMRMVISSRDGLVAASCVVKGGAEVVILDAELKGALVRWTVPEPVQDLAWSPDGKQLALLFYDPPWPYDPKTGKVVRPPSPYPVKPNVAIFDPTGGKELLRFNTSAFDAKITFSPDGNTIFSISHHLLEGGYSFGAWGRDTLRAFDSKTGEMKERMVVPGTGVRDNFAVSPDGSLIVAESTKDIAVPLWREPGTAYGEDYGFVILDSSTGAVLFKEKLRRPGFLTDQLLPLFFSADGKQVVANFNSLDASNVTDINVYSIAR